MHLTFHQSPSDLTDLTLHSLKNSRWTKIFGLFFLCMIILNMFNMVTREGFQMAEVLSWIIPIAMMGVIWYVIIKVLRKRQLQNPANRDVLVGKREIELSDNKIRVVTPIADTQYQWSAITKLGESKKNYFMYMGSTRAILVSKTAFQNKEEEEAFKMLVLNKIEA